MQAPDHVPATTRVSRRAALRLGAIGLTGGAYPFVSVRTKMEHFDELATPWSGIHFAGEHSDRVHFSTVHGAYLGGLRAAREVLEQYGGSAQGIAVVSHG